MDILIDKRITKFVEGFLIGENEDVISIYLKDIDETFHFDNKVAAQDFLNKQAIERVGNLELRKGYFDYVNPEGETHRYLISKVSRGKIVSYIEDVVSDDIDEAQYIRSSTMGDYSPSNPWDAPGMSISDFI